MEDINATSHVKFGGWDQVGIQDGHNLSLINTVNKTSWAVRADGFSVGHKSILSGDDILAILDPNVPYVMFPSDSFSGVRD